MLSARRQKKLSNGPQKSLKDQSKDKLKSGLFRHINELLYTKTSDEILDIFAKEKRWNYANKGYDAQISKWPCHPLDLIVKRLRKQLKSAADPVLVIDMGAGSCRLSEDLKDDNCIVVSVDFAPPYDRVACPPKRSSPDEYIKLGGFIEASMSSVPLPDNVADYTVFSLSLMGIDWPRFVGEAIRLSKPKSRVVIAEVTSRLPKFAKFIKCMERVGLELESKTHLDDNYFTIFNFKVASHDKFSEDSLPSALLLPCKYKNRSHQGDEEEAV